MQNHSSVGLLTTLNIETVGVLVTLIEELVRTGAVDRARLLANIKEVYVANRASSESPAELEMAANFMLILETALEDARG